MFDDTISAFRNQYAFLSNFYECPVHYRGLTFPSVEAAFQAAKCADPSRRSKFQYLTARDAKRLGRTITMRPDWDESKISTMLELLLTKFGDSPELLRKLLATGNAILVEGNTWHDNFWGYCTCGRSACEQAERQNMLGKLLMSVRGMYREKGAGPCHATSVQ